MWQPENRETVGKYRKVLYYGKEEEERERERGQEL